MKLLYRILILVSLIVIADASFAQKRNKKNKENSSKQKDKKADKKSDKKSSDKKDKKKDKKEAKDKKSNKKDKKGKKNKKEKEESASEGNDESNNSSESNQEEVAPSRQRLSQDTNKPNVVTITSSFKPTLRTAAKINMNATMPEPDATSLKLGYNIPAQNLFFTYQPVAIKPLVLTADSNFDWKNNGYVKVGVGNLSTINGEAAYSFGHPSTTIINLFANYATSKGTIAFQEFTKANFNAKASFGSIANHDLILALDYKLLQQYKFGTKPGIVFTADQLKQNFNAINFATTFINKLPNGQSISYKPNLSFNYFGDNDKANEISIALAAPLKKNINDNIDFVLTPSLDITNYKKDTLTFNNNLYSIAPNLIWHNKTLKLNVSANPTWNNTEFNLLPNINFEYKIDNEKLVLQGGWASLLNKNTYKSLATFNPFIAQQNAFVNTKTDEQFVTLKGSLSKHFSFSGTLAFAQHKNMALFVNDNVATKSQNFNVVYEPKLNAFKVAGEIAYTNKEKLSWINSIQLNQFTSQDSFPKAFGIIPLQISSSIKYKVLKDVFVKGDVFFNDGNYFRVQTIQTDKTPVAFDVNLGAEYKVMNKLNICLDFNNLFNNQYQRWNQYNVFGFNIVAGIVYSFK